VHRTYVELSTFLARIRDVDVDGHCGAMISWNVKKKRMEPMCDGVVYLSLTTNMLRTLFDVGVLPETPLTSGLGKGFAAERDSASTLYV
jgi:hypothetical protein